MRYFLTGKILIVGLFLVMSKGVYADDTFLQPDVSYQPGEVVRIVIEALGSNEQSPSDDGIATVYRFASPGNRASTGPLSRFAAMIKQGFSDMLNFSDSRFDPIVVSGDRAVQSVWLMMPDGRELGYLFQMGKQQHGEFAGMWMTEGVAPLGQGPNSGTRI